MNIKALLKALRLEKICYGSLLLLQLKPNDWFDGQYGYFNRYPRAIEKLKRSIGV